MFGFRKKKSAEKPEDVYKRIIREGRRNSVAFEKVSDGLRFETDRFVNNTSKMLERR